MKNIRQYEKSPYVDGHEDFELWRGAPTADFYDPHKKSHRKIISRIRDGYYDFAICWWGDLGKIVEVGEDKGGNYMLIKDLTEDKSVRETMEMIDWHDNHMVCIGAPQLTKEMFVATYERHRLRAKS